MASWVALFRNMGRFGRTKLHQESESFNLGSVSFLMLTFDVGF